MATTIERLAPGRAGTLRTLEVMAQAVRGELPPDFSGWRDEAIRRHALVIVADAQGHDEQAEISSLFEFVRDRVRYRRDPLDTERVQDAARTLELLGGDCDDKAVLLATLLACLGYLPRFVAQAQRDGGDFDHVYVEVFDERGNEWRALDPTADGFNGSRAAEIGWRNPASVEYRFPIFPEIEMANYNGMGFTPPTFGQDDEPWWARWGDRGLDVLGAYASRSPYYSPDDPRYRQQQQYPVAYPPDYRVPRANDPSVAATFDQSGTKIAWWMWALIGALAGAYFLGKKR